MADIFFPSKENDTDAVVSYCVRCPVRKECDDKADRIGATHGIWGGRKRKG
jgi:hypothetical protein